MKTPALGIMVGAIVMLGLTGCGHRGITPYIAQPSGSVSVPAQSPGSPTTSSQSAGTPTSPSLNLSSGSASALQSQLSQQLNQLNQDMTGLSTQFNQEQQDASTSENN
ncbi:MAG: hypothetical protein ACP5OR_06060 [Candidatus Dormibacteria bacterium]